jgi:hypothetical protein
VLKTVRRAYATALLAIFGLAAIPPEAGAQIAPVLPLPAGKPVVTMTSPASGSTVTGTVAVSARVNTTDDSQLVAGVQFKLDGVNLGAEDRSAPYTVSWNTTTADNGPHTLSAVMTDWAGVQYASDTITVTVSNDAPPPSAGLSVTRFEETDSRMTFTSDWTQDGGSAGRSWSGATAVYSATPGAQASFTFTGPSVSWIGALAPQTGIARVLLDGVFVAEVDTFSKTEEIRVPVFTLTGLADASHTLTIEVTGRKNENYNTSTGTAIVVDAFDVPAPVVSRLQETDPAITYTADWIQRDTLKAWSAGTAAYSTTPGAQATFVFTGTSITWIGARGPQSGIARVFLDGAFVAEVDTYATEQIQAALFTATGLADASHTLTIEVTGLKNVFSAGAVVVVDAFEVTSPGTRFQDTHSSVAYSTGWALGNRDKTYSEGSAAESSTPGAQATFTFTGTSVSWIGGRGNITGIARVFLDGAFVDEVDTFSPTEAPQKTIYTLRGLDAGTHTLTIEVTGLKNAASGDTWILIDAFDVAP